jgi:hypothetical protein
MSNGSTTRTEGGAARIFREALGRAPLRRALLALGAATAGEFGSWVAMLVYANREGGARLAAFAAAGTALPGMLIAPIASSLPDRVRPGRVLTAAYGVQAAFLATGAMLIRADRPVPAFVALAAAYLGGTVARPAHNVLLPSLVSEPEELAAATVPPR